MDGDASQVTVHIDGSRHRAAWSRGEVLLDVLIRHGIDVPYACREGHCGACVCRVSEGAVAMKDNSVLQPSDIAEGYVLACQAIPEAETITVSYDD